MKTALKAIYLLISTFFLILFSQEAKAQQPSIDILTTGTKTSLRGLSVVNNNVIWVSGSNGVVGRSTNGGKNWQWMTVRGFEKNDFRDIEAFSASNAIIMSVAEPAYILKTTDGGENWKVVYQNNTKGMFLDAMDFMSGQHGIVVGDPINNKAFIATTADGGDTWQELKTVSIPTDPGEAFFAASGTNVRLFRSGQYFMVSGGTTSSFITGNKKTKLPIIQGKETTGANSIDVYDNGSGKNNKHMVVVGGDFNADSSINKNCFISSDGGKKWKAPKEPPHGYRSCVEYLSKNDILSCGINGVDYSYNRGKTWKWISRVGFNVCKIARMGDVVFLAGNNGKVAKVNWR
jgi:photosystem II stability/assembly factor-like uncharacterized protein